MSYNASGSITTVAFGNGLAQNLGYNSRLQQISIAATLNGTTLMDFAYDYGTANANTGRVLSRTDAIQSEHGAKCTYDSFYRLSQVISADTSSSWGETWTFDIWGNRLTQTALGTAAGKAGRKRSATSKPLLVVESLPTVFCLGV